VSYPISLKGDMHISPAVDPGPRPYIGGPIIDAGQDFVTVGGVPVAVVGGKALCSGVQKMAMIISGSSVVTINGKPVARMSDSCEYGGKIVQGTPWLTCE